MGLVAVLVLGSALGCGGSDGPSGGEAPAGEWHAWLDSPGGSLPFGLRITAAGDGFEAALLNGPETIPVPSITIDGAQVRLSIDHYDSVIHATLTEDGTRMDGDWKKTSGPDTQAHLVFHATRGRGPRFEGDTAQATGDAAAVAGRWSVRFDSSEDPAVGIFEAAADGTVTGTFLTTTGDYRFLAGVARGGRLLLSCFDGAHAFLFDAQLQDDGTLAGDFWSRDSWHETWTAGRDSTASLPDAFEQTTWVEGADLASAVFPDLDGKQRSLSDPEFDGKARVIEVFGTWCPNCNDATEHLVELQQRYGDHGLSVVGLAFEMTGDFQRDAEQVRKYKAYKGIEYPVLLAGLSDKAKASDAFPLIDRIRSFPTTIFLHGDGRVRAVHSGYSGPATGPAYDQLRERWNAIIEELLAE